MSAVLNPHAVSRLARPKLAIVVEAMTPLEAMRLAVKHNDPAMAYALYLVGHRWVEAGVDRE